MNDLIYYFYNLFKIVFQASIAASILIGLLLIIRKLLQGKLGIKLQYALWFIVILRLTIPKLPESSFSIFNLITKIKEIASLLFAVKANTLNSIVASSENRISSIYNQSVVLGNINSMNTNISNITSYNLSVITILALIWMIGVFTIGFYIIFVNIKFRNKIKKQPSFYKVEVLKQLESCKKQMKIHKKISLIKTQKIKMPALFGYFNPKILLPENILEILPLDKLRYVFLHELAHLKRKDILINWIISILRLVHWFNPIIQYGLRKMAEDMEVCCDSLALSYTKDDEVKEYGLTIINLMDSVSFANRFSKANTLLGTTSIVNNKSEVRRRIVMIKLFNKKAYKFSVLALVVLMIAGGVALTDAKASPFNKSKAINIDKIDLAFVNDSQIVGKWKSVDFVNKIEDYKVNSKDFNGSLFIKELSFTSDGKVPHAAFTWTKDHILNPVDKTDSKYVIKDIEGSTYLFFEWKSGDYTIRGMKPKYYVMKKISSTPSLTTNINGEEVKLRSDKIDYPFINDPEVIGKWQSVDFVEKIKNFKPKVQLWNGDLYLNSLIFKENGKFDNDYITWTKDLIINSQLKTASKYSIKEIDGSKYMFFQWKNGDYVERGATPWYYVLKQVN